MAIDDLYRVRTAYRLDAVTMYMRSFWREVTPPLGFPATRSLARRFDDVIVPRLGLLWDNGVDVLYHQVDQLTGGDRFPTEYPSAKHGAISGDGLPPSVSLVMTCYVAGATRIHRGGWRIGGISETLQENGVLTDVGLGLGYNLAEYLRTGLLSAAGGHGLWECGLIFADGSFAAWELLIPKSNLRTQRTRHVPPGIQPGA